MFGIGKRSREVSSDEKSGGPPPKESRILQLVSETDCEMTEGTEVDAGSGASGGVESLFFSAVSSAPRRRGRPVLDPSHEG